MDVDEMNKKMKKFLFQVGMGHLTLWSVFFIGVFCTLMSQTTDLFLIMPYAGMVIGLLILFSVSIKYFPKFKSKKELMR